MREEDSPAVANVVVELDRAVRGVGLEVGGNRAETEARNKIISQFRGLERYTSKDLRSSAFFSHCNDIVWNWYRCEECGYKGRQFLKRD